MKSYLRKMHKAEIRNWPRTNPVWVFLAGIAIVAGLGLAWIQGDQGGPKLDSADTIRRRVFYFNLRDQMTGLKKQRKAILRSESMGTESFLIF